MARRVVTDHVHSSPTDDPLEMIIFGESWRLQTAHYLFTPLSPGIPNRVFDPEMCDYIRKWFYRKGTLEQLEKKAAQRGHDLEAMFRDRAQRHLDHGFHGPRLLAKEQAAREAARDGGR